MYKKYACALLSSLMLLSSATACTGSAGTADTDGATDAPGTIIESATETPTDAPAETETQPPETEAETEIETEPPIEIEVPAYEDIGLTELLSDGDVPYAPADTLTELRDGYTYLLSDKRQIKTDHPITLKDGVVLMDVKAAAQLFGFDCTVSEDGTAATLTRAAATLTFTAGTATVDLGGTAHACPTAVARKGTLLISADYLARWMGYTTKTTDTAVFVTATADALTEERLLAMSERYDLYRNVVYNYDDVEIDQIGVGEFDATPHEDRLVGIAYSTWHSPSFTNWGPGSWDLPMDGPYCSDDPDVIYKHGILLRDAGIDFVFVDWTNNTDYDPVTMGDRGTAYQRIEETTDLLFEIWSKIEGAPKICIFAGPGHSGPGSVKNGNHQRKVDQIYTSYVEKYPDMYFTYRDKPLLMCYGATPNLYGVRPTWKDNRFTVRWVTGFIGQQSPLFDDKTMKSHQWWSWEERGLQTYATMSGDVECVTCTAASRSQSEEGMEDYIPAYGRENGLTLKRQFQRANDLGARIVLIVSWNEWTKSEQHSVEISKDIEPSAVHGTFYYDLLCEQIKKFKGQIPLEDKEN